MRARLLKPGFFRNEVLADVPFEGRLLFQGLWCLADREGRLEDRHKRIKADLFPYDDVDVDALLGTLAGCGFIRRYVVDGAGYIQVTNFGRHQNPHPHEPSGDIPAPPADTGGRDMSLQDTTCTAVPIAVPIAVAIPSVAVAVAVAEGAPAREAAGAATPHKPPAAKAAKSPVEQATPAGYELLRLFLDETSATLKGDAVRREALQCDALLRRCHSDQSEAMAYFRFRLARGDSPNLRYVVQDYAPGWRIKANGGRAGPNKDRGLSTEELAAFGNGEVSWEELGHGRDGNRQGARVVEGHVAGSNGESGDRGRVSRGAW